jgi:hypothetical protein
MADKKQWTLLVYMAGDNDLDSEAVKDIREMLLHGTGPDVVLVVQVDRHRKPTRRYVIPAGPGTSFQEASEQAEVLPEINTGDPRVLVDFLAWGRTHYPAERCGVVLWNHGLGWLPADLEDVGRRALGPRAATVPPLFSDNRPRRGAFRAIAPQRHALFLHPALMADVLDLTAYIGLDEGNSLRPDALDTHELGRALAQHVATFGPLDMIGFDACLMAQLEVAYEIHASASIFVGSEEVEPGVGWPYHAIALRMKEKSRMTADELAQAIAESYIALARTLEGTDDDNNTHSVLRLDRVARLARATAHLGAALTRALPERRLVIRGAAVAAQRYDVRSYADLGHFASLVSEGVPETDVRRAAHDVLDALTSVVAYHGEVGDDVAHSTGISIYLPNSRRDLRLYRHSYGMLSFVEDHPAWLEFLLALHALAAGA